MKQKIKRWYRLNSKEIALSIVSAAIIAIFLAAFNFSSDKAVRFALLLPLYAGKLLAVWKINRRSPCGATVYFFITNLMCSIAAIAAAMMCFSRYKETELACIIVSCGILFNMLELALMMPSESSDYNKTSKRR